MARFLLIDSSLRNGVGHHDSYARRMLQAAERFGYQVAIAAHLSYRAAPLPPSWRVERVFDHAIYDDKLLMPDWGTPPDKHDRWPWRRNLAERWQAVRQSGRRRRMAASHAAGFAQLFARLKPSAGDQIHGAAASELVLLGLAQAARADRRLGEVDWHLLFHFGNLLGRPDEWQWQTARRARLARAIAAAQQAIGPKHLHLYATTTELAAELSSHDAGDFVELGYPIDERLRTCGEHPRRTGPLRIVFAGDARIEKGFHHLPEIVASTLSDPSHSADVRFVLQANFAFRLPCQRRNMPIVAARERLARYDEKQVTLLTEPLDEPAYEQLILDAGLIVLPYDSRHYYSRCSGVLVEALSAAVPVVAPANCSMASHIEAAARGGLLIGEVAGSPADFAPAIAKILANLERYRADARRHAKNWTRWHHPTRIVAEILSRATSLAGLPAKARAETTRRSA